MKIHLETIINRPFQQVATDFDRQLFEFLLPPKAVAKLVRYDGSNPGDIVHIRFRLPYGADWISEIISRSEDHTKMEFVDIGTKLPLMLTKWHHRHMVDKVDDSNTRITDEMIFSTCCKLLDYLAYPVLFLAFYPRKKKYKLYFEGK